MLVGVADVNYRSTISHTWPFNTMGVPSAQSVDKDHEQTISTRGIGAVSELYAFLGRHTIVPWGSVLYWE